MNEARILIVEDELIVAADLRERLQEHHRFQKDYFNFWTKVFSFGYFHF